jgi:RND family efflux transporter MFP subunit
LKFLRSKKFLAAAAGGLLLVIALAWYVLLPVAEVAPVQRGTAIAAVYGTVRIEPTVLIHVRAQNSGFVRLVEPFTAGRAAIGREVKKGDLFATITDESTARQLQQARNDLQAAVQRGQLPLPASEPLRVAEDALQRIERLTSISNVAAVEVQRAKSDVARLRGQLETERIERDRNIESLEAAMAKLEAQMKNTEIRAPMDGLLTGIKAIEGDLVSEGNELFTVSSRENYVRGEVNEEDVGEVKIGMEALLQVYAFRQRQFSARVTAILPAADPETQRYTIVLDLENPPENLLAGMTGEMNIITGRRENALLLPTRALLIDQALVVSGGFVQARTVNVGYRTLDFVEVLGGAEESEHVIVSDQDRFRPGQPARSRVVQIVTGSTAATPTRP